MRLRDSMILAVIVSAAAVTFALTTSEQSKNTLCQYSDNSDKYAETLHQGCAICNESGHITDSINGTTDCPACGGSGEIIAQQYR